MKNVKNYLFIVVATTLIAGSVGYYLGSNIFHQTFAKPSYGFKITSAPQNANTDIPLECTKNEITEQCAKDWVKNYGTWAGCMAKLGALLNPDTAVTLPVQPEDVISSWTIPVSDLVALLAQATNNNDEVVIAFLGAQGLRYPTKSFPTEISLGMPHAHLILTTPSRDDENPSTIPYFDLIQPCPQVCNQVRASALYDSYKSGFENGYDSTNVE